jgi:hypothetical protein
MRLQAGRRRASAALLLLSACMGHGLEPTSEDLLRGTWGSAGNGVTAVLEASQSDATFRAGCITYHATEPLRLTRDRTFTVAATQSAGPHAGPGFRLQGRLRTNGTVLVFVLPPPPAGARGPVAVVVPDYDLLPHPDEEIVRDTACTSTAEWH